MSNTSRRGFASMDAERQRQIASKGGKAAHQRGTAHEFTTEEARLAGRKGGERRSQNAQRIQTTAGILNARNTAEATTNVLNASSFANNSAALNAGALRENAREDGNIFRAGNVVENVDYARAGKIGTA